MVAQDYVQWPVHCVQGSFGAEFDPYLRIPESAVVVKKGFQVQNDSYSAYGGRHSVQQWPFDGSGDTVTNLQNQEDLKDLIQGLNISRLFVAGLAIDYCVKNSILDSIGKNVAGPSTMPNTILSANSVALIAAGSRAVDPQAAPQVESMLASLGVVIIPDTILSPTDALNYYCDQVEMAAAGDDTNKGLAIGLGIGLTLLGFILIGVLCYCCRTRSTAPQSSNYADHVQQDDQYKPLHDL